MSKQDGRDRRTTDAPVDDLTPTILHVDLDAFFASVELLDRPELVGKPVVVGHRVPRSIVTAANYAARRFGVTAAMPMGRALQLCPQAVVLPPHYGRYTEMSRRFRDACLSITPLVEQASIDEAYLDVAGARGIFGSPYEIAVRLRAEVQRLTGGLTCSVGAATSVPVAKIASSAAKPDGLLIVPASETLAFLEPLAIGRLPGVGPSAVERLRRIGVETVRDARAADDSTLLAAIGSAATAGLRRLTLGIGRTVVHPARREKSVGHSVTFVENIGDPQRIEGILLDLADRVAQRLRTANLSARTVTLTMRRPDFTTVTRSRTLPEPVDVGRALHRAAVELYRAHAWYGEPLRLVGVRAEHVEDAAQSSSLWSEHDAWGGVERTADALRARFGRSVVGPATLLDGRMQARDAEQRRDPRQLRPDERHAPEADQLEADQDAIDLGP